MTRLENKFILWDFDGTLGYREGMWSGTVMRILSEHHPELRIGIDQVRPYLQTGFPWDRHEEPHTHIRTADEWWKELNPLLAGLFQGVGLTGERADELAVLVRQSYVNPVEWKLFDDVLPTLQALSEQGWKHAILSNHVPELSELVEILGLSAYIEQVFNSAWIGYEKPNPQIFRHALQELAPVDRVWMVGDNVIADIQGAEAAGIPAILVRKQQGNGVRVSPDVRGVIDIVCGGSEAFI